MPSTDTILLVSWGHVCLIFLQYQRINATGQESETIFFFIAQLMSQNASTINKKLNIFKSFVEQLACSDKLGIYERLHIHIFI